MSRRLLAKYFKHDFLMPTPPASIIKPENGLIIDAF
jgi:hypothetical protein